MTGCTSVTEPDTAVGAFEYFGVAEPGLLGRTHVKGQINIRGCRFNLTGEVPPDSCYRYKGKNCVVIVGTTCDDVNINMFIAPKQPSPGA